MKVVLFIDNIDGHFFIPSEQGNETNEIPIDETDGQTGVDNELKKEIDRLKTQNDQLQNEKEDAQKKVRNLIMERDNLKAHVDKMRQDFEEKTTRLQKENEKLRQENAKLSREQSRMNHDITDLTSGNQARDDKINSVSTENEKLRKEMENIKSMVSHGMVGKKWKTGSGLFLKSLINLHVLSMQVKILITLVLGGKIAALGIITSPIFPSGLRIIQS